MVHTYDDPVKRLSHDKLREFAERNLSPRRKPADIRVLCFGGAEEEGKILLEVEDVYDRMGILRPNVISLEKDAKRAKRQEGHGVRVVQEKDVDFLRDCPETFDIISLDYTGQQGKAELESLLLIASRHLLRDGGILCTNYSARRESDRFKRELLIRMAGFNSDGFRQRVEEVAGPTTDADIALRKRVRQEFTLEHMERAAKQSLKGLDLDYVRDAVTFVARAHLQAGSFAGVYGTGDTERFVPKAISMMPSFRQMQSLLSERRLSDAEKPHWQMQKRALTLAGHIRDEVDWIALLCEPQRSGGAYLEVFAEVFGRAFRERLRVEGPYAQMLFFGLCDIETKPYGIADIARYSYVSNKNFLMLMDMYAVRQSRRLEDAVNTIARYYPERFDIVENPFRESNSTMNKAWGVVNDEYARIHAPDRVPERVFLGASKLKRRDPVTDEQIIDFLRLGCTPSELNECFSYKPSSGKDPLGSIRAIQANLTMGRYG